MGVLSAGASWSATPLVAVDEVLDHFSDVVLAEQVAPLRIQVTVRVAYEDLSQCVQADRRLDELSHGLVVGLVVGMQPAERIVSLQVIDVHVQLVPQ